MPVARRRYDITPAEMLDLARSAVDAVVAELKGRTQELLPDQTRRLEEVSEALARTVKDVAETSYRAQVHAVENSLQAVRQDIAAGIAEHDARLVQAVETHLAGQDPGELSRRLPAAVAEKVLSGLDDSLPVIDKGVQELRDLVGELIERGKRTELARQGSLDRLDEILVQLRAGLAENLTRQHAVLLEVLDQKLSELKLTQLADELPARIGAVISESVQRSHELQTKSLEAGLSRHRSAAVELSESVERMAGSVSAISEAAEEAVTLAFERAQAAQAQRLATMVAGLREAQEEASARLVASVEEALGAKLDAGYDALAARIGLAADVAEKGRRSVEDAVVRSTSAMEDVRAELAEHGERVVAEVRDLRSEVSEEVAARVTGLMDSVPHRLAADIAAVLEEARARQERVESLIAELAWVLGEQRAGASGLRDELARALDELPAAIAGLKDAALRSEARVSDLLARTIQGGDAR